MRFEDYGELECDSYVDDEDKLYKCFSCEYKEKGYIKLIKDSDLKIVDCE